MKKLAFASAAVAGLLAAGSASAADLAARPTYKAPPPMVAPAPVFTWTGCYIGANIGGGWTHKHFTTNNATDLVDNDGDEVGLFGLDEGSHNASGIVGGGQVGCDYQFASNWVIGIQTMWDAADLSGDHSFTFVDEDGFVHDDVFHTRVRWFGTLTGRLGFLITPSLLLYGKGGVAWVGENHSLDDTVDGFGTHADIHTTRTGWDAGVGLEWMFAPSWTVFVEWDHMGFGHHDEVFVNGHCCFSFNESVKQDVDKVVVGVNWRFGWFGKATPPVAARY